MNVMKKQKKAPGIIFREGRPSAVVLDIEDYREMLEKLEDVEDLKMLEKMRSKPLGFKKLEEYLEERK